MELLKRAKHIEKRSCSIEVSEITERYIPVCLVTCEGKFNWTHVFHSVYGGDAILHEKHLFDLPNDCFLVYQINEHSRGAHCEYEMQMLNLQGDVLNGFTDRYFTDFLLNEEYVWFLKSVSSSKGAFNHQDQNLIQLDINTGRVKQESKLNYSELLGTPKADIHDTKLTTKNEEGFIWFSYTDKLSQDQLEKLIPIKQFY